MYFHNSLIPRGAYFLLPLESKQEAISGWNFTKCISEVKVNQLKWKIFMLKWAYPPLKAVAKWFKANKLTLNTDKTKFMIVGTNHILDKFDNIISPLMINWLKGSMFLSILALSLLVIMSLSSHINYLSGNVSKKIGVVKRHILVLFVHRL